ncbi:MAG TPA: hypothetical protein PK295_01570 [Candidatus Magasanikbacteria bacterium]|nr:hypothetical protein [Candidatus Magasanikbacteria bacterium]
MSLERKMEAWSAASQNKESIDSWFESLSLDEREEAFFESQSFDILVEKCIETLKQMQENVKEQGIFLRWPMDTKRVSYGLGNVILKSPSLLDIVHRNENVAKYITQHEGDVARRLFSIFSYPNPIPPEAYNIDIEWEEGRPALPSEE